MSSRASRGLGIGAALVAAVALATAMAAAKPHKNDAHYPSTLVIDHYIDADAAQQPPAEYGFYGFVRSPRQLCEQHRAVELVMVDRETHAKTIVARTRTDIHGNWRVRHDADGERYFARTHTEKVFPPGGTDHIICGWANASRQTFGEPPGPINP
ncbi:MAG: hypothetical protein QOJ38_855 [Solirubrobacterales bacterium]|jgi:hypothetical protein|nr:hypothetical protein [Solirubrobacterales bacterium]